MTVKVKSGAGNAALTTSVTVAVCARLPLAPVIVSVDVPTGVLPVVVMVSVEVPDPFTVGGEKLAVVPAGSPPALNVTVPLKPPDAVTVDVYVVAFPAFTVWELGVAPIANPGPLFTIRFKVTTCVREPLIAVTVSV